MKTYEQAFKELEQIVQKLEAEDTNIDDAIEYFKQAVELQKYCETILKDAQQKVVKIIDENNQEVDFE